MPPKRKVDEKGKPLSSLSRGVRVDFGNKKRAIASNKVGARLSLNGVQQQEADAQQRRAELMQNTSTEQRTTYEFLDSQFPQMVADGSAQSMEVTNIGDNDWEDVPIDPDDDVHVNELLGSITMCRGWRRSRRRRNVADDLARSAACWQTVLPKLSGSYLGWKHTVSPVQLDDAVEGEGEPGMVKHTLAVLDLSAYRRRTVFLPADDLIVGLAERGYLATTPQLPVCAMSFKLLNLYHRLRVRAHLSHEAFVRSYCAFFEVPYKRHLREQCTHAYDAYVAILEHVRKATDHAFGNVDPNWRMLNSCPACEYRLEGESALPHSKCWTFDGNNSAKRFSNASKHDHRVFKSDYFIPREHVDLYKDEVKASHSPDQLPPPAQMPDVEMNDTPTTTTEVTDGTDVACADRWKTSNAERNSKSTIAGFEETGMFLSACRHGFILLVADMVKSGELAKYGLAMTDRLLDVFGNDQAAGYDIGCSFSTTVNRTSIGPKARQKRLRFYVGAFHGYAHNRACQLHWHPRITTGAGLEDFEFCERCFSSFNKSAYLFRHASSFHRHQTLHLVFQLWDEDRYAKLGDFLLANYKQALANIANLTPKVNDIAAAYEISPNDWERFRQEERDYLARLQTEPEEDTFKYQYVEILKELRAAQERREQARTAVREGRLAFEPLSYVRAVNRLDEQAEILETALNVESRWTPGCRDWDAVDAELSVREYNKAVDHLEGLVVQRLFEMEKLQLRGLSYNMRSALGKALNTRSSAIRTAVDQYNRIAKSMTPPRRTLDTDTVLKYAFIAEFALLRESRHELLDRLWMKPAVREATTQYFLLQCSKEEIQRLNVEIRRVITSLKAEQDRMFTAIRSVEAEQPDLAAEMSSILARRVQTDQGIRRRLHEIALLPGFTGSLSPGRRLGSPSAGCVSRDEDVMEEILKENGHADDDSDVSDDEWDEDQSRLAEGLSRISEM